MGVIAKRPIANAAWRHDDEPKEGYHVDYWKRLIRIPVDLHASDPLPTAASHGGIELGGARESTGTRIRKLDFDFNKACRLQTFF
ncbi:MAG: hypothetical protein U0575_05380 [Phycisphaerales bacterium]